MDWRREKIVFKHKNQVKRLSPERFSKLLDNRTTFIKKVNLGHKNKLINAQFSNKRISDHLKEKG